MITGNYNRALSARGFSSRHWLLIALTICQLFFWRATHDIAPQLDNVPDVPSNNEADVLSLGDPEFYFRWHAFDLQNIGSTYGRTANLHDFNYQKLYLWFSLMDRFDRESNFFPAYASYYLSRTDRPGDLRYLVQYLKGYTRFRLEQKWYWQVEAVHIADHKINDGDLALETAVPLQDLRHVPIIVRELPAFVYERRGEMDKAQAVMDEIRADTVMPQGELNFIADFIENRLKKRNSKTLYYENRTKPDSQ